MTTSPSEVTDGQTFRDLDWYAEDLGARAFVSCIFIDADLTEVTSRGARFEDCEFRGCQLNASTHDGSSFTGCRFSRTSFFAATLRGCKLVGSTFVDSKLRQLIKSTIGVSVAVDVVAPDTIERSVGKMRRVVDQRPKR